MDRVSPGKASQGPDSLQTDATTRFTYHCHSRLLPTPLFRVSRPQQSVSSVQQQDLKTKSYSPRAESSLLRLDHIPWRMSRSN